MKGPEDLDFSTNCGTRAGWLSAARLRGDADMVRSCLLGERFRDSVRSIGSEFGLTEGTAGDRGAKGRLKVDAVAANTSGEVTDAALALCSRKIDAVCQVMGNLTASSFVAIARATTTRPDAWPPCWLYV